MKKRVAIFTLALCMLLLGGCSTLGLDSKKPDAVTVWHYYNGKQKESFDALVEEFNQTQGLKKGIVVTAESKGDVISLEDAVIASAEKRLGAQETPDIFASYMDLALRLHQMEMLIDMGEHLTEAEQEQYLSFFLDEGRLEDGALVVLPVAKSTELLYLNKTAWDQFSAETGSQVSELDTWEELAEVAERYDEWSGGKTFLGRDAAANFIIIGMYQLGADLFQETEDGVSVQLDHAALRKIWDVYAVPYIKGHYGAFGRYRSDDIKTGDIIAAVGSTSSSSYYSNEITFDNGTTHPIEITVLPLPNFRDTSPVSVQQGAGMAVMKSTTRKEESAVTFLKWFTEQDQNVRFCTDTGYFPVKLDKNLTKKMAQALQDTDKSGLKYRNVLLGLQSVLNYELYAPPPSENGSTWRESLEYAMTKQLDLYRTDYLRNSPLDEESFFEERYQMWVSNLELELQR